MSQNKVYQALRALGGEATTSDLKQHLESEYPNLTLSKYATNRLRKLEEKDIVEIDDRSRPFRVRIIDNDWDGISESLEDRDFPPK